MATEIVFLDESHLEPDDDVVDDDDRPTVPAYYSPLCFDTAAEAFFVQPFADLATTAEWPVDEEQEVREIMAGHRRRAYGAWVAVLVAGSLTLLAAAWLPLIGG